MYRSTACCVESSSPLGVQMINHWKLKIFEMIYPRVTHTEPSSYLDEIESTLIDSLGKL